ncbi:toxic anion resistance protein [Chromobacterium piscinae]|uniref:toxic anion resistance protein n=1 Tax=Chromobacterium piscinae TaxID=686831 RepID=UPI0022AF335B|nr:toxic anion resistance protein [Chromobacterium piscinae]
MQPQQTEVMFMHGNGALTIQLLQQAGLAETDLPEVQTLARQLDMANPLAVSEFGRDVAEHTARYADSLLDQVQSDDLEGAGSKLNQVVVAAKSLNLNALSDRRSRIPVIGRFIDRMKITKEKFVSQFRTTKDQIDTLLHEVEDSQKGLAERVVGLEQMFVSVKEEHRLLGLHIVAGKVHLESQRARSNELQAGEITPAKLQEIQDMETTLANLDKRIGDLQALQHSALQSLPMIRMIQANNNMLVEKFHTIRELTVPSWKRQFMLALSLNEQQNAVQLAESIDDATNEFLRSNATLLRKNSVETARSNQRLVIDISTLEQVQSTLISTVEDVIRIQQEGIKNRKDAENKILAMRTDLQHKLTNKSA